MIILEKTSETTLPVSVDAEASRFELIRKAATERHSRSDTDGTRRRARQTAEDNRLL